MSVPRDPDRLIRAFLDEGRTDLPTATYDTVRSDIERTRQRVVIGPWREPAMSTLARFGIAVAAVLIVAILGLGLSRSTDQGPAGVSPSPGLSPTPASPSPTPAAYAWPGPLPAGTYTTSLVWDLPFTTTFTVPSGWQAFDIEITKDPTMFISFSLVDTVYTDPCVKTPADPPIGPNVSDLADGLRANATVMPTSAEPVAFAGATGLYVDLTIGSNPGCSLDNLALWREVVDKVKSGLPYGGPDEKARYPHHRIWILDVGGLRYVIDAAASDQATAADLVEQQHILDSILISQPAPTADCTITLVDASSGQPRVASPYVATLGSSSLGLLGPVPEPFPSLAQPFARIDFRADGSDWPPPDDTPFRLIVRLTAPGGGATTGFATSTGVGGLQGSMLFDAPGDWLGEFSGINPACPHTFLFDAAVP